MKDQRMAKVLIILNTSESSHSTGFESFSFVPDLLSRLKECSVLSFEENSRVARYLEEEGVTVDTIKFPELRFDFTFFINILPFVRKLFRYFQMNSFGLVHACGIRSSLLSILLKVRFNVPLVWQIAEALPTGFESFLFKGLAGVFADRIIAGSLSVSHEFGRDRRWKGRIRLVYPGFALTKPLAGLTLASGGVKPFRIAAIAPTLPIKAPKTFLRAIQLARRQDQRVEGVLLVEDPHDDNMKNVEGWLSEFDLGGVVHLIPYDPALGSSVLAQTFKDKDIQVFVSASLEEELFASDVLHAMAADIPVVATRSRSIAEILSHGRSALLVPIGEGNAMADAALKIMQEPGLAIKLQQGARQEIETRFSRSIQLAEILRVYSIFLGKHILNKAEESSELEEIRKAA